MLRTVRSIARGGDQSRNAGVWTKTLALVLAAAAVVFASPASAQEAPVTEGVVVGAPKPLPIVTGPGGPSPFPCQLEGNLLDGLYDASDKPLRAAMIFVDFADATGAGTDPQALYDNWVPQASAAFSTLSRGEFTVDVTPHAKWVRMPEAFSTYGFGEGVAPSYEDHHGFIAKAIAQVDPEFDFSSYSTVYVVTPPTAALRSAADAVASGEYFKADGHDIGSGVTLGTGDPTSRSHTVFLHETGHLLGLPDLYPYDSSISDYVGPWDIMAYTYQPDTPMTAWTRLLVGWMQKSEIRCVRRTTSARLTAVTASGGTKALAIRTGRRQAVVVEARTDPTGTFCRSEPGVLVYSAAVSAPQGGGPIRVADPAPDDTSCDDRGKAQLLPGKSFADPQGRFVVTDVSRDGETFDVKLEIPKTACRVPKLVGLKRPAAARALRTANCRLGKVGRSGRGPAKVKFQNQAPGTVLAARTQVGISLG